MKRKKIVLYSQRRDLKSKFILLFVSFQIIFSPILADANIIVDQTKNQKTSVDQTQSGVDQVNISSPSAAGVSHNSFDKFNVSSKGVVINNSAADGVSVIGGAVYKNPNFQTDKREASIILNEVTGTSRSDLLGWTEIFGKSAEYVLANPNGIYVNGAGFINTPKVTLTTGVPEVRGGELLGIGVKQGTIMVGEQGVDITGLSYFGILARAAQIGGQIADNLGKTQIDFVLGQNDIDYESKEIESSSQGAGKPEVALDASALGSIFAGSIKIISTENGVGVNSKGLLWAGVGDVEITSSGKVVCKDIYAKNRVKLESEKAMEQTESGLITAESGDIDLHSDESMMVRAIQAGGEIDAFSGKEMTIAGDVVALGDVSLESSEGAVVVQADDAHAWKVFSDKDLTVKGKDFFNENGILRSGQELVIEVLNKVRNTGEILAGESLSLQGKEIENSNLISSDGDFFLNSENFANEGFVYAGENLRLGLTENLQNAGAIYSLGLMKIEAESVENFVESEMVSKGDLNLLAQNLEQSGLLKSELNVDIDVSDFENKGTISGNCIDLTGENLQNKGSILSSGSLLSIVSSGEINNYDTIVAEGSLQISSKNGFFNEQNSVLSGEDITLQSEEIANDGLISAGGDFFAKGENFINSDLVVAGENLDLKIGQILENAGTIYSLELLKIETGSVENLLGAEVESEGDLELLAESLQQKGLLKSAGDMKLDLAESEFENQGTISGKSLELTVGDVLNRGSILTSGELLSIVSSGSFVNYDTIVAGGSLQIHSENGLLNAENSVVAADGDALLCDETSIENQQNSQIFAEGSLDLKSTEKITNDGGNIFSGGDLSIGALTESGLQMVENLSGTILSEGDFVLQTDELINEGEMTSFAEMSLQIEERDFTNAGDIFAQGLLNLDLGQTNSLQNGGLLAGGGMQINAKEIDNASKIVAGSGGGEFSIVSDFVNNGQLFSQGNLDLRVGADFANNANATLFAEGDLSIITGGDLSNRAIQGIYAGQNMSLKVDGELSNDASEFTAVGDLDLETGYLTSSGNFYAKDSLRMLIRSGNFENKGELVGENLASVELASGKNFINRGLVSGDSVNVSAYNITNYSNILIGNKGGKLKAGCDILNHKTISSQGGLLLDAKFDLANYTGSSLLSGGKMEIVTGSDVYNYTNSTIYSGGDLTAEVANLLYNYKGSILSKGKMSLMGINRDSINYLYNFAGDIQSEGNLVIKSDKIDNISEFISSNIIIIENRVNSQLSYDCYDDHRPEYHYRKIILEYDNSVSSSSKIYVNSSNIQALGNVSIEAKTIFNNRSKILSNNNIILKGNLSNESNSNYTLTNGKKTVTIIEGQKAWKNWRGQTKTGSKYEESRSYVWESQNYNIDIKNFDGSSGEALIKAKNGVNVTGQNVVNGNPSVGAVSTCSISSSTSVNTDAFSSATIAVSFLDNIFVEKHQNLPLMDISQLVTEKNSANSQGKDKHKKVVVNPVGEKIIADAEGKPLNSPITSVEIDADFGSKLYKKSKGENPKYVVETRDAFVMLESLYGSEYLLDRIDYHPEQELTFTGDPFYEMREVNKAIEREYRQRYILEGCASEQEQYEKLLENGAKAYRDYNLAVGIELSAEQINSLQEPIVWLVEAEVDGKKVLTPKLYFPESLQVKLGVGSDGKITSMKEESSNLTENLDKELAMMQAEIASAESGRSAYLEAMSLQAEELAQQKSLLQESGDKLIAEMGTDDLQGSVIKGQTVSISGGAVSNSCSIIGEKSLRMDVESIVNDGGDLLGEQVSLQTEADLINKSGGNIFADSALVLRVGGNLSNLTDKNTVNYGDEYIHEELGERSSIGSGGSLDMMVKGDFTNRAGDLAVAGDARILVDGKTTFETVKLRDKESHQEGDKSVSTDSTKSVGATMAIGGNLFWRNTDSINITAGKIDVGGYGDVDSKASINIMNDYNTGYRQEVSEDDGWISSKKTTEVWESQTVVGSEVNFGTKFEESDKSKFSGMEAEKQTEVIDDLEKRLLDGEDFSENKKVNSYALQMATAKATSKKNEEWEKLTNKDDLLKQGKEAYLAAYKKNKDFDVSAKLTKLQSEDPLMYSVLQNQARQAVLDEKYEEFEKFSTEEQESISAMVDDYLLGDVEAIKEISAKSADERLLANAVISKKQKEYSADLEENFEKNHEKSDFVQELIASVESYKKMVADEDAEVSSLSEFTPEQVGKLEEIKAGNPLLYKKIVAYAEEESERNLEYDFDYQDKLGSFEQQLAKVAASEGSSMRADGDILLQGSKLTAGGDLEQRAGGDINIYSVEDYEYHDKSVEKSGMMSDIVKGMGMAAGIMGMGEAYSGLIKAANLDNLTGKEEETQKYIKQIASETNVDGDLSLLAGNDINMIGSDITTTGNADIDAGGDLTIAAAPESSYERTMSQKTEFGKAGFEFTSSSASLSSTSKTTKDEKITNKTTFKKSVLNIGGDLSTKSGGNTDILASDIFAEGSIDMFSGADINILTMEELEELTEKHEEKSLTTSLTVGNKWVEAAATAYETGSQMYEDTKTGGDAKAKAANNSLRAAKLANAVAGAASTSASAGFYGGVSATTKTEKTTTNSTKKTALGSVIRAGNGISMNAKGKITNEGSDFLTGGDIFLEAEEVEFRAGKNSFSSTTRTETKSVTVGASTALSDNIDLTGNGGIGLGNSKSESSSLTYRNATANAGGTFTVKTSGDATFSGANVIADVVDMTQIGGDVLIESLLDEEFSSNKSSGINAGGSEGSASFGVNVSSGSSESKMVREQTSILGKRGVKVSAKKLTNKGAVLAHVDNYEEVEQEKSEFLDKFYEDNGLDNDAELSDSQKQVIAGKLSELEAKKSSGNNLEIVVEELVVEDVKGKYRQNQSGFGINVSATDEGKNDKVNYDLSFQSSGQKKDQLARATIGNGKIVVSGKNYDDQGLNRDISKSLEITRDEKVGGYDASVNFNITSVKNKDGEVKSKFGSSTLDGFKNIQYLPGNSAIFVKDAPGNMSDLASGSEEIVKLATDKIPDVGLNGLGGIIPSENNSGGVVGQVLSLVGGDIITDGNIDAERVYVNGMNTDLESAKKQGSDIFGQDKDIYNVNNRTHGFVNDILECAIGYVGLITTTDFQLSNINENLSSSTKKVKVVHSQGNIVEKNADRVTWVKNFFRDKDADLSNITVISAGSPENESTMRKAVELSGQKYYGMYNNDNDGVSKLGIFYWEVDKIPIPKYDNSILKKGNSKVWEKDSWSFGKDHKTESYKWIQNVTEDALIGKDELCR